MKVETLEEARKRCAKAISMGATFEVKRGAGHNGSDIYDAVQYTDIDRSGKSQRQILRAKYGWAKVAPEPVEAKAPRKPRAKKVEE